MNSKLPPLDVGLPAGTDQLSLAENPEPNSSPQQVDIPTEDPELTMGRVEEPIVGPSPKDIRKEKDNSWGSLGTSTHKVGSSASVREAQPQVQQQTQEAEQVEEKPKNLKPLTYLDRREMVLNGLKENMPERAFKALTELIEENNSPEKEAELFDIVYEELKDEPVILQSSIMIFTDEKAEKVDYEIDLGLRHDGQDIDRVVRIAEARESAMIAEHTATLEGLAAALGVSFEGNAGIVQAASDLRESIIMRAEEHNQEVNSYNEAQSKKIPKWYELVLSARKKAEEAATKEDIEKQKQEQEHEDLMFLASIHFKTKNLQEKVIKNLEKIAKHRKTPQEFSKYAKEYLREAIGIPESKKEAKKSKLLGEALAGIYEYLEKHGGQEELIKYLETEYTRLSPEETEMYLKLWKPPKKEEPSKDELTV